MGTNHDGAINLIPELVQDRNAVELFSAWKSDGKIKFLSAAVEVWPGDQAAWAAVIAGLTRNIALRFGPPGTETNRDFVRIVQSQLK